MTSRQNDVLVKLKEIYQSTNEPEGPTQIGLALGFEYDCASSKCMNSLKKLVKEGLGKSSEKGKYVPII